MHATLAHQALVPSLHALAVTRETRAKVEWQYSSPGGHGRMSCRGELQEEFQGRAWGFGRVPRVPTVAQEPEVREEVLMSASRPPARVDGGGV